MGLQIIIDNNALVYAHELNKHIEFWEIIKSVVDKVLVPLEVKNEFANSHDTTRQSTLALIEQGIFLDICTQYDTLSLEIFKTEKNVDAGEAEAAAQQQSVNADFIWSDDKKFTLAIKKYLANQTVLNTLHIIARLQLSQLIIDYPTTIKQLHFIRPINKNKLRLAFNEEASRLGFKINENDFVTLLSYT